MEFFKETKSYQFVTLLEKLEVEHKYLNIFIYLVKLFKFNYIGQRKIKKRDNIEDKIKYVLDLFKERYYLEQLKGKYNIKKTSGMNNNVINNIIVSEISYDKINMYVEYGLMDQRYSIFLLRQSDNKGINLTKDDLSNEVNYDIFINLLEILHYEVSLILGDLLLDTVDRMRRVRKNV